MWEHADNLLFLIPLYTLGASLEASSYPSRCGRTVSLRHKMIKVVKYPKDQKIYILVLNLHSEKQTKSFFFFFLYYMLNISDARFQI